MFRLSHNLFRSLQTVIACAVALGCPSTTFAGEGDDDMVAVAAAATAVEPAQHPVFSNPLEVTNVYAPIQPGAVKVYRGKQDGERLVVTELHLQETRTFHWDGGAAETRMVKEFGFKDGVLDEVSWEFFAQADDGTVYQFGELVDYYENGEIIDHEGSWLVGGPILATDPPHTAVAPAPTVLMPADPKVGDEYKPEDLYPIVDETVLIVDITRRLNVPGGRFTNLLKLRETSRIPGTEPEKKWVAKGVGVVRTKGIGESLVLISASVRIEPEN